MAILDYQKINSRGGGSSYFCLTVEGSYSGASGGKATVTGSVYMYYRYTGVPYYAWSFSGCSFSINGVNKFSGTVKEPNSVSDWKDGSWTIGGVTYKHRCLLMGPYTQSVTYGYGTTKSVSVSGTYKVGGSADYLPVAGTYTVTGNVKLPAQTAPAPTSCTVSSVTTTTTTAKVTATVGGTYTTLQYSKDGSSWQSSNTFTGLYPDTSYNFYARAQNSNSAWKTSAVYSKKTTVPALPTYTVSFDNITRTGARMVINITNNPDNYWKIHYYSTSNKWLGATSSNTGTTYYTYGGMTPNTNVTVYTRVGGISVTGDDANVQDAVSRNFTTSGNPPVAEKIEVLDITRTSARLNMWGTYDTNAVWEEADYTYGIVEGEYTQTTGSIMENLEPNTTYYIKARFKDNWDRWSNYVYNSFTTIGNAPSNIIINLDNIGETNVELTVSAEPDTNAIIEEYAIYQDDSILVDYQASPIFNIDNLQEETEYNIVAKAKDNWDRIGISETTTFTTLAGKWIKIININGEITTHKCYLITPAEKIEIKKDAFKILGG